MINNQLSINREYLSMCGVCIQDKRAFIFLEICAQDLTA